MHLLWRVPKDILQGFIGFGCYDRLIGLFAQLKSCGRLDFSDNIGTHRQFRRERLAVCVRGQFYGYTQCIIPNLENGAGQPEVGLGISAVKDALKQVGFRIAAVQFDESDFAGYHFVDDGRPVVGCRLHRFGGGPAVCQRHRIYIFRDNITVRRGQFYKTVFPERDLLLKRKLARLVCRTHINQRILW